ncbi:MAG: glycosyltransferase family 9 protein [Phycisphaerae bacterium]
MNDLAGREFRRILLIKPSSPGDIIHALPVLRGLRRRYPQAHVAWLVATPFVNLIEADPALDEVILFDRKRYGRLGRSLGASRDFLRFVGELWRRRFDLVIDLQGLFRSGFLSLATGSAVRIGFRASREFAWVFYNHWIPRGRREIHAAERNYAVAKLLGFDGLPLDFTIALTDEDRRRAAALLTNVGIASLPVLPHRAAVVTAGRTGSAPEPASPGGCAPASDKARFAALVPATRWQTKCWPAERYGRLALLISQSLGIPSILVGGAADIDAGEWAVSASAGTAHNLCGRTTLRELAALIEEAAVVVTADSTPMHMAAAFDRPLVALFGPTNPVRTGPCGHQDAVIRLNLACSPCYLRSLSECPHDHRCLRDLTVEAVAEAVAERLTVHGEPA